MYGSIRRSDCAEAEVVLANGVYLTFRLETWKRPLQQNVVEVKRGRMNRRNESIPLDARLLAIARKAALRAILTHRAKMHLPVPPVELRLVRPVQLRLPTF
jgi:hypothetical protein